MKHIWYNKDEQIAIRYFKYLRIIAIDEVWIYEIQFEKIHINSLYFIIFNFIK